MHKLYVNTYEKSDYKLERLESSFFQKIPATKMVFIDKESKKTLGFVLLKKDEKKLYFMFCGMDYTYETADLYYFMIYHILVYAMDNQCEWVDLGQTSEETKLEFGARLEKRYFYAHHSNPLLNMLIHTCKSMLEYSYSFPSYRVFGRQSEYSCAGTAYASLLA